jgi:hypothetical protein
MTAGGMSIPEISLLNRVQRRKRHPLLFVRGGQFDTGAASANDGSEASLKSNRVNAQKPPRQATHPSCAEVMQA